MESREPGNPSLNPSWISLSRDQQVLLPDREAPKKLPAHGWDFGPLFPKIHLLCPFSSMQGAKGDPGTAGDTGQKGTKVGHG